MVDALLMQIAQVREAAINDTQYKLFNIHQEQLGDLAHENEELRL